MSTYTDFLSKSFDTFPAGSFLEMKFETINAKRLLNHTIMFFNYLKHDSDRQVLSENFTTQSPIYISDHDAEYVLFENNTFDSNIGLHGGAIQINHGKMDNSSTSTDKSPLIVIFNNNTFTRNIAYLDGTAIYVTGGKSPGVTTK
jgi:hypothetical protein